MRRSSCTLALVLLAATAVQAAEPQLGRLFHTPSERAALEDARRRNIRAEELAAEASKQPRAPRARIVTVTGIVQRSDGEAYAWVNGKPVDMHTGQGRRMRLTPGQPAVVMRSPDQGRSVEVKVGQRADLRTGRVQEAYELKRGMASSDAAPAPPVAAAQPRREVKPKPQEGDGQPGKRNRDAEDAAEDEDENGEG